MRKDKSHQNNTSNQYNADKNKQTDQSQNENLRFLCEQINLIQYLDNLNIQKQLIPVIFQNKNAFQPLVTIFHQHNYQNQVFTQIFREILQKKNNICENFNYSEESNIIMKMNNFQMNFDISCVHYNSFVYKLMPYYSQKFLQKQEEQIIQQIDKYLKEKLDENVNFKHIQSFVQNLLNKRNFNKSIIVKLLFYFFQTNQIDQNSQNNQKHHLTEQKFTDLFDAVCNIISKSPLNKVFFKEKPQENDTKYFYSQKYFTQAFLKQNKLFKQNFFEIQTNIPLEKQFDLIQGQSREQIEQIYVQLVKKFKNTSENKIMMIIQNKTFSQNYSSHESSLCFKNYFENSKKDPQESEQHFDQFIAEYFQLFLSNQRQKLMKIYDNFCQFQENKKNNHYVFYFRIASYKYLIQYKNSCFLEFIVLPKEIYQMLLKNNIFKSAPVSNETKFISNKNFNQFYNYFSFQKQILKKQDQEIKNFYYPGEFFIQSKNQFIQIIQKFPQCFLKQIKLEIESKYSLNQKKGFKKNNNTIESGKVQEQGKEQEKEQGKGQEQGKEQKKIEISQLNIIYQKQQLIKENKEIQKKQKSEIVDNFREQNENISKYYQKFFECDDDLENNELGEVFCSSDSSSDSEDSDQENFQEIIFGQQQKCIQELDNIIQNQFPQIQQQFAIQTCSIEKKHEDEYENQHEHEKEDENENEDEQENEEDWDENIDYYPENQE